MDKRFCENLRACRKACGLTQAQVAKPLNVTLACYSNWEQGRTEPDIETLRKLAKMFHVTLDILINGPDDHLSS